MIIHGRHLYLFPCQGYPDVRPGSTTLEDIMTRRKVRVRRRNKSPQVNHQKKQERNKFSPRKKEGNHQGEKEETKSPEGNKYLGHLTQLESRIILFEDLGRQFVTYGHREAPEALCRKIDEINAEEVMNIARRAISKPVLISGVGNDLKNVPNYDQVLK